MLFGALFDDPAKVLASAVGVTSIVLWAILSPRSGAEKNYRAGEASGRAWWERHPVLSGVLAVVIIGVIVGTLIYLLD